MTVSADLYARQASLGLRTPQKAMVVGCGGTGTWVALFLAMMGTKELTLVDFDVLEESNRARLPFCAGQVGKPKVEAVNDLIMGIRPDCLVIPVNAKVTRNMLNGYPVFDCTDHFKTQLYLKRLCQELKIPYIRCGYDLPSSSGDAHITVSSSVPEWGNLEDEETAYANTPSFVAPAVIAAGYAVFKAAVKPGLEISTLLSETGIPMKK